MKKTLISLLVGCASLIASAGPSILSIKQSITDDAIVYPESFETDTHRMMQNWYLKIMPSSTRGSTAYLPHRSATRSLYAASA